MNAKRRALELSEHISHKKMELAQLIQYYWQEQQKYSQMEKQNAEVTHKLNTLDMQKDMNNSSMHLGNIPEMRKEHDSLVNRRQRNQQELDTLRSKKEEGPPKSAALIEKKIEEVKKKSIVQERLLTEINTMNRKSAKEIESPNK